MSRPFVSLLKVSLLQSFDFRKKDKAKNASLLIPIILIFVFGCFFSLLYSFLFSFLLVDTGNKDQVNLVLYAMVGLSSMLSLVTGISKTKGTLYGGNDYDMLASLPISKRSIIFVKLFSLYLVQAFYAITIITPATFVTALFGGQPLLFLDGFLCILFSPIIPLVLSGILGILIGFVSDRFKFGNIITIVLYAGFLGVIMYASYQMNSSQGEEYDPTGMIQMFEALGWFNPSTKLFTLDFVVLSRFLYVILNLIILAGTICLFAACYDYFHTLMNSYRSHSKYVEKAYKQKGQFKALFFLDLNRYFSSKMYMMNTITGGIVCIFCTVIMIVSFTNIKDPEAVEVLHAIAPYFVLIIVWCVGMAVPSAVAINMEGKTMWQIKSLPISYKQYSLSKILLSYIVLCPFVLVASSILCIYVDKTVVNILITFLLPQIYLFSMCCVGYFINLHFYKLKWSNETEAVKNSAGTLFSMLIDFGYTGILCVVLIIPGVFGFFTVGAILATLVILAMTLTFGLMIRSLCSYRISSMEC